MKINELIAAPSELTDTAASKSAVPLAQAYVAKGPDSYAKAETVLLSVVDGLLDADHKPVRLIKSASEAESLVRAEKTAVGKGGMSSKIAAAKMVTDCGESLIVADGRMKNILPRLLDGEELGTLFVPGTTFSGLIESDADKVMRGAISELFRHESDVRQLIKLKAVYESLESATDKCQDVANVIESVVLENS
jgi:hypothetical protein